MTSNLRIPARIWAWPGYLALTAALVAQLAAPGLVHRVDYLPLLVSLVVLGLPHGAVDHLVPAWVDPRGARAQERRRTVRLVAGYVALTAAGVLVWFVAPTVALGLFLLVAVVHWGRADLNWAARPPRRAAFVAARGAIPVLWPAVAWPHAYAADLQLLLAPFAPGTTAVPVSGTARAAVAALLVAVAIAGRGRGIRAPLELGGLIIVFSLVDPLFAVGVYFIAWHSWRHVLRLASVAPVAAGRLRDDRPLDGARLILRASLPCTAIALAGIGALAAAVSVAPRVGASLLAPALALIAALTVPHAVLVEWLDRRAPRSGAVDLGDDSLTMPGLTGRVGRVRSQATWWRGSRAVTRSAGRRGAPGSATAWERAREGSAHDIRARARHARRPGRAAL